MFGHVTFTLATVLLLPAAFGQLLDIKKGAIVHLFEWKWDDIARECEEFLAPKGFAAVMTSPPHENPIVEGRPWNERLQVVSYKLISRSGNEEQLKSMLQRCNKVGVRVFAQVVINHMTPNVSECKGVGGSECDSANQDYPQVPYNSSHFHPPCDPEIKTTERARECKRLDGYNDLDLSREDVRERVIEYLNHLTSVGFAGFMIDSASFMEPADLSVIYKRVNTLNASLGFPEFTRPFIYQDITDLGNKAIFSHSEYYTMHKEYLSLALVSDGEYNVGLNKVMKRKKPLYHLRTLDSTLVPDFMGVVSVDGFKGERSTLEAPLTYKSSQSYKVAIAFLLARGHGYPLLLSGFKFESADQGPPSDETGDIRSPAPSEANVCANGWVCQHRWRQIYAMVAFNKATYGTGLSAWWDNGNNQIAFSRGNKGFVAFNLETYPLNITLKTELPAGKYCDVISGAVVNRKCEGATVEVNENGYADVFLDSYNEYDYRRDGVLAIFDHESSRLPDLPAEIDSQTLPSSTLETITTETPITNA